MNTAQAQQFKNILDQSNNVLIAFKKNWMTGGQPAGVDAVASSLALQKALAKLQKPAEIAADGFTPHAHIHFLDTEIQIQSAAPALRRLTINVDLARGKVSDLSYDIKDGKLKIFLTPDNGMLCPGDITSENSDFKHDLIITVDSHNLNSLGGLYSGASELFFAQPIINIDHNNNNEHFGQLNMVDFSASSNAEIIFEVLESMDKNLFDEKIATLLLAGIISKTHGFKLATVTPKTLNIASKLIAMGAKREEIVHNFYRTREIPTLKLWGRALARLKAEKSKKLVWSILTKADFIQSGAEANVLSDVIQELIATSPEAETVVLLYENVDGRLCGLIASIRGQKAEELGALFGASGTPEMTEFCVTQKNLIEAERMIIEAIKARL
jgi:phosphoesterase RecJ-like protein